MADAAAVADTLTGSASNGGLTPPSSPDPVAPPTDERRRQSADLGKLWTQHQTEVQALKPPAAPDIRPWDSKIPEVDPLKQFGSWATTLGIMAGLATRQPFTASLTAAGEAMKAIRAGDLKRYEDQKQTWKDNVDIAIKKSDQEWKAYEAAMRRAQDNWGDGMAMLKERAAEFSNWHMMGVQDADLAMRQQSHAMEMAGRRDEMMRKAEDRFADEQRAVEMFQQHNPGGKFTDLPPEQQMAWVARGRQQRSIDEAVAKQRVAPGLMADFQLTARARPMFREQTGHEFDDGNPRDVEVMEGLKANLRSADARAKRPETAASGTFEAAKGAAAAEFEAGHGKKYDPAAATAEERQEYNRRVLDLAKQAPPGSPAAERAARFDATKARMEKAGQPADDNAVWDAVDRDVAAVSKLPTPMQAAVNDVMKRTGKGVEEALVAVTADLAEAHMQPGSASFERQAIFHDLQADPANAGKSQSDLWQMTDAAYQKGQQPKSVQARAIAAIQAEMGGSYVDASLELDRRKRQNATLYGAGSVAERGQRFLDEKRKQQADGTYTTDSRVWDTINRDVVNSRSPVLSEDMSTLIAEQVLAGNSQATAGFGRAPKILAQIDDRVADLARQRGLTGEDLVRMKAGYHAYARGLESFAPGGFNGKAVTSLNTVVDHLDVLDRTVQKLGAGDVVGANALWNTVGKQIGWDTPLSVQAISTILGDEIQKAVSGGAGAVQDREDLRKTISPNMSPQQLAGVVSSYKQLMAGQLAGKQQAFASMQDFVGNPRIMFDNFLTPRAAYQVGLNSPNGITGKREHPETQAEYEALPVGAMYFDPDTKRFAIKKGHK